MSLYPKIESPFKRHIEGPDRNKFMLNTWSRPEFKALADLDWEWSEKIDGTNVRVIWDGHRVTFGGRTDNAQMPVHLLSRLQELFPEELMEQAFGATEVILFGEGYGPKIQKGGGLYRSDVSFILFDVRIGRWWLESGGLVDVSLKLGIDLVPQVHVGPVVNALKMVACGLKSQFGDFWSEGLVGKVQYGLLTRAGERIMMKVKHKDLFTGKED